MTTQHTRITLLLALGWVLLGTPAASAASPAPCQILPAETWSGIMGYAATATPGDMNCTYEGPGKSGGGQFRIIAVVGSSAEAEASAKRMRDHQHKGSHDPSLGVVESQGHGGVLDRIVSAFGHRQHRLAAPEACCCRKAASIKIAGRLTRACSGLTRRAAC